MKLDIHIQKSEVGPLPHTLCKNHTLKYKTTTLNLLGKKKKLLCDLVILYRILRPQEK